MKMYIAALVVDIDCYVANQCLFRSDGVKLLVDGVLKRAHTAALTVDKDDGTLNKHCEVLLVSWNL